MRALPVIALREAANVKPRRLLDEDGVGPD
jgi:hypothetical protein